MILVTFVGLELVALWFAWRAITSSRTSQGAVGWVIFLITAPYLGVPLYLFLGHHKFERYLTGRRDSEVVITGLKVFREANTPENPPSFPVETLEKITDLPVVGGNSMHLLIDGRATFEAIFDAIDQAKDYVLVQFYIVHDDALGQALAEKLIAAAKRGVKVRFLCDAVGSAKLPQSYRDRLRNTGVKTVDPKQMGGPKNRFQLNLRNHRKTVVVDGIIGFTGGLNVGDEYMGRNPKFGDWRDTHVLIKGPVVSQLQLVFLEDWHWATEENLLDDVKWEAGKTEENMPAIIAATGPGDAMETGALFFYTAIANAKKRVWIASPYFVPDTDILTALKHAAIQGVEVRILVPDVIDHKIPWLAAFAYFDEVRAAGVQVWRYKAGFMHQKVVLVDDTLAAVGTTNMDNRSFRLNFEAMAVFLDAAAAKDVEKMLDLDFSRAFMLDEPLEKQAAYIRIGAPIARLFSPVL